MLLHEDRRPLRENIEYISVAKKKKIRALGAFVDTVAFSTKSLGFQYASNRTLESDFSADLTDTSQGIDTKRTSWYE
jgi:hypothetical protein